MTKDKTFSITIDNRKVDVKPGVTILEAARQHDIFIPSLCALENLPSFGACRMCIVEVDGLRGYPTACTTPVEDGMIIRTDTAEIKGLRQEILKLVLSEHPGTCLFCGEKEDCMKFQGTIRKVGMTTGCRYCPNDGQCELQQITEKVGVTDTSYTVSYRNFPVEKEDPFYDRDYNLCVLCGRCVRVCNSLRMNGTLSFKQRGKLTTIGPAFHRSHIDGGCEFCGACVNVCPTGTLSTKTSKWYGKPDREAGTTCPYCSIGCRLVTQIKGERVIDVLPDYTSWVDHGLICMKGRFAVPEYVNSPLRITAPRERMPMGYETIQWDRAIAVAAERLAAVSGDDFLMLVSPQLNNEDLFAAQQFTRQVMASENITSSMTEAQGPALAPFLELACSSDVLDTIDQADLIFALGFDSRYGYSPAGIRIKKAVENGKKLVTLHDLETNLDVYADVAFKVESSYWRDLIEMLLILHKDKKKRNEMKADKRFADLFALWRDEIEAVEKMLDASSTNAMVIGPDVFHVPDPQDLFATLVRIKGMEAWKTITAHNLSNINGMIAMGAVSGIKPGEAIKRNSAKGDANGSVHIRPVDVTAHRKLIYVVGDTCPDWLPPHDYLIYQNALPPLADVQPDLVLPAAPFTESAGTTINVEGRILPVEKVVEPLGLAKADWWILSRIAEKMNRGKMNYADMPAVQAEIKKQVKGGPETKRRINFAPILVDAKAVEKAAGREKRRAASDEQFLLYCKSELETYRGIPLAEVVVGMKQIANRGYLLVNADDAVKLGLEENCTVDVSSNGVKVQFPVRTSAAVGSGVLHLLSPEKAPFTDNPSMVQLRRNNE